MNLPSADFKVDPKLAEDTIEINRLHFCRVLLMNDSNYPWLILVPQIKNIRELHELPPECFKGVFSEITFISKEMEKLFKPDKLNVAALGNQVSQLHIHIIARFKNDAAWPLPVWGANPIKKYGEDELETLISEIQANLFSK
ncbi:MAG: hypothetical protein CL568_02880 [Alphaproteobacteria bacterium]|nr:hypothetical protein [Alphaproteobacteria bacterium]PPR14657.1 MAG: hypothetical protein CFH42_00416 [Alphaproteobacteria bacterium MarineAlpha12_Bin1]|tara:strand:- start:2425 stop:2850 length:426 start_codon:yes stop_codon:yes gene_type:complete